MAPESIGTSPSGRNLTLYRYRSPLRPLDLCWAENAAYGRDMPYSWLYEHSDIGPWTPSHVYTFAYPLPPHFVSQWSLELLP